MQKPTSWVYEGGLTPPRPWGECCHPFCRARQAGSGRLGGKFSREGQFSAGEGIPAGGSPEGGPGGEGRTRMSRSQWPS